MKKQLFILIILLGVSQYSSAQITFQKSFGGLASDQGNSVQQTTDGGYIIAGYTLSFGAGFYDFYLIKTNANGDTMWTKTFGEVNDDRGYSVQQTTDGGYIIAGTTDNFGAGGIDFYLIKTDANGNSLWTKTLGGTSDDYARFVQQTSDGGYIIAGYTYSFGTVFTDIYLIKTDANGDSLWTKTFGGTSSDYINSVQQTTDGGYIIVGTTNSFGVGGADVYLTKTDANGDPLWTKTFGGTTGGDEGYFVQQTSDGGCIITGYTYSFGAGARDIYLIRTDANGDSLWTKTFGGSNDDVGNSVQQAADGGFIITGFTSSFGAGSGDVYLIKTDANGTSLWTRTFGGTGNDVSYSVRQTTDGGYIIAGSASSFGAGQEDVYLIKTDSMGNSGCNEFSTATIVTTTATQVTSPATMVTSPPTIVTSQATVVGSGGIVTALCTSVDINELTTGNLFHIYPNPSAGNFIISFNGKNMKGNIEILNTLGGNIFTKNVFNESKKEINLKNISSGIYLVKVFDGEKYYCNKIIIEQD